MRRFWKQPGEFEQLETELRRGRPRPRSEYLETLATQVRGERVTRSHRPSLRNRVAVAVALTGVLGVAAAASGGLSYADAATSHTMRAVAHVFTFSSVNDVRRNANHDVTTPASPASPANAGGSDGQSADNSQSNGDDSASAIASQAESIAQQAENDARSHRDRGDNAARRQYVEFVFICLRVPPRHPFIFITLRVPRVAADALIARGLATLGAC